MSDPLELFVEYKSRDAGNIERRRYRPATSDHLLAVVRRGVESGTIKGEVVEIHPNRLRQWHTLHIGVKGYKLDHPMSCDLDACEYQTHAESWEDRPDEFGVYRWDHEPVLESWMQIEESSAETGTYLVIGPVSDGGSET